MSCELAFVMTARERETIPKNECVYAVILSFGYVVCSRNISSYTSAKSVRSKSLLVAVIFHVIVPRIYKGGGSILGGMGSE